MVSRPQRWMSRLAAGDASVSAAPSTAHAEDDSDAHGAASAVHTEEVCALQPGRCCCTAKNVALWGSVRCAAKLTDVVVRFDDTRDAFVILRACRQTPVCTQCLLTRQLQQWNRRERQSGRMHSPQPASAQPRPPPKRTTMQVGHEFHSDANLGC